ncbi:Ubiquitin-related domain,Ubiquitin domain [Cinara cedri]|uniref:Ubiquitin-related domain,Ubiquitin domain n=1 Tax=Cinara cedri TaxID=506608 RepID=A0A5E4N558_9HEMI|nr:Ubiquitin-related domain,Ubiquitin domain [Cinara cedri]
MVSFMNSYLMIQHKKQTIFTDARETILVLELKTIIAHIIKVPSENQQLFYKGLIMDDKKSLADCGIRFCTAPAYNPAAIGLALRMENGEFEPLEIAAYSTPPDLLSAITNIEANGQHSSM